MLEHITLAELAAEFGLTVDQVGKIGGLMAWSDVTTLPAELAERVRYELHAAGYHATPRGDDPLARNLRTEAETQSTPEAPAATGLTLETYDPSPLVIAAIDAAVHQTSESSRYGIATAAVVGACTLTIATAVAMEDLVQKGVAPYADGPGVYAEPNREAIGALSTWTAQRAASAAVEQFVTTVMRRGGRGDTTIIALLRSLG